MNGYLEITLLVSNNGSVKPIISYRGIPNNYDDDTFIFEMEDEILSICRTFSMESKKQQQNLIDTLKQNCRRIVKEKTGKKPFTNINIARTSEYYWLYSCICHYLVDSFFFSFTYWYSVKK